MTSRDGWRAPPGPPSGRATTRSPSSSRRPTTPPVAPPQTNRPPPCPPGPTPSTSGPPGASPRRPPADPSRISLDRATAAAQGRALASAMAPVLGTKRLPMLIVDSASVTRSGSARGAGVLGMATFGRDHAYALDADGRPDAAAVGG